MKHPKPVLMIHAMSEDMFSLPLHEYTLTFDDGLYSQWKYFDRLAEIDTDKLFFVSTAFICHEKQTTDVVPSSVAHTKARQGNFEDFMTVDQIRQITETPRCFIGGHGHLHLRLAELPRFVDRIKAADDDLAQMLDEMQKLVGNVPTSFCFPYNYDIGGMYQALLKRRGIVEWYGRERTPIETLLHIPYP